MGPRARAPTPDISADPFQELRAPAARARLRILGCDFEFETSSPELHRIVQWAFAGLPRHSLTRSTPRFRIRIDVVPREPAGRRGAVPPLAFLGGAGLLCATTEASNFVALSPAQRAGLILVSQTMLRSPYHVRYELIEFAVATLAQRVQGLVPLHAACLGMQGRGLLLMGASGAGKSTAALQWIARGHEFLSEDSVLVTPGSMRATGVPNFLHIRRDAVQFAPAPLVHLIRQSPVIRRRSGIAKFEIDLRRPEFRLAPRPLELVGTVFMTAEAAGRRPLITPLRRASVLARLQASQPYAVGQPGWTRFTRRIASRPAFELSRGREPCQTVLALEDLLSGSRH
jgi:hypothetical protein